MNKPFALLSTLVLATGIVLQPTLRADVVRPAPEIALETGKSLKALRGQPVILLVAPSPRSRAFRKQVKRFEEDYQKFAARKTVFIAAFTESTEGLRSNLPFAVARDGAAVATAYGIEGAFGLIVIGADGNLDLKTEKVSGTYRAMDAIQNNFVVQANERRS